MTLLEDIVLVDRAKVNAYESGIKGRVILLIDRYRAMPFGLHLTTDQARELGRRLDESADNSLKDKP